MFHWLGFFGLFFKKLMVAIVTTGHTMRKAIEPQDNRVNEIACPPPPPRSRASKRWPMAIWPCSILASDCCKEETSFVICSECWSKSCRHGNSLIDSKNSSPSTSASSSSLSSAISWWWCLVGTTTCSSSSSLTSSIDSFLLPLPLPFPRLICCGTSSFDFLFPVEGLCPFADLRVDVN